MAPALASAPAEARLSRRNNVTTERLTNSAVFVLVLAGGLYYAIVNKEAQGSLVVLLGILYFVAAPYVWGRRG